MNSALRQRHEQERLREILSRIESYDAVEAKDEEVERLVKVHCDLDLTRPMPFCSDHQRRHLLIEGDLKLRDQVRFRLISSWKIQVQMASFKSELELSFHWLK